MATEKTLAELYSDPEYANRNSDLTTEDVRALLADEITPEDIERRRQMAYHDAHRAKLAKLMEDELSARSTRSLLLEYRSYKPWSGHFETFNDQLRCDAIKTVLDTREHVVTNKKLTKEQRRLAAKRNRGQGKNRNR